MFYLVGKCSIEEIQKLIECQSGQHVSIGSISTLINKVGSQLPKCEVPVADQEVWVIALDEVYAKDKTILVMVDPRSLYIFAIILASNCTQLTWQKQLDDCGLGGAKLKFIGDAGKGRKATAQVNGSYLYDNFHALSPLKKLIGQFESVAL